MEGAALFLSNCDKNPALQPLLSATFSKVCRLSSRSSFILCPIMPMVVSIIADRDAPYGLLAEAMHKLREVEALNVNFATGRLTR